MGLSPCWTALGIPAFGHKALPKEPEALKELGQVTGYLRRRLSTAVIRANVRCLLERMLLAGEGVGQAGMRRQWARQEEAVGKAGGGEGEVGERGTVAGKVDDFCRRKFC